MNSLCLEGELIAQCNGPTQPASCRLENRGNGGDVYTLVLKPHEAGTHTVLIKFNGEHVPGKLSHSYIKYLSFRFVTESKLMESVECTWPSLG